MVTKRRWQVEIALAQVDVQDPPHLGDDLGVGLADVGRGDDAFGGGAVEVALVYRTKPSVIFSRGEWGGWWR